MKARGRQEVMGGRSCECGLDQLQKNALPWCTWWCLRRQRRMLLSNMTSSIPPETYTRSRIPTCIAMRTGATIEVRDFFSNTTPQFGAQDLSPKTYFLEKNKTATCLMQNPMASRYPAITSCQKTKCAYFLRLGVKEPRPSETMSDEKCRLFPSTRSALVLVLKMNILAAFSY